MKLSKTTLKELTHQYRSILKKCAILNAAALTLAFITPAHATDLQITIGGGNDYTLAADTYTGTSTDDTKAGVLTIDPSAGVVKIENGVTISNSETPVSGGAIKALGGFTAGDDLVISNNTTTPMDPQTMGGGIYVRLAHNSTQTTEPTYRSVSIGNNADFSGNFAAIGGALAVETADGGVTLGTGATFSNNTAGVGGAIATWDDPKATGRNATTISLASGSKFLNNTAIFAAGQGGLGGAIANITPNNTINIASGATFAENEAAHGGAIFNMGTTTIGDGATFSKNLANAGVSLAQVGGSDKLTTGGGGAIFNWGTLSIGKNAVFAGNEVTGSGNDGGAIFGYDNSIITIDTGALFSKNIASDDGGAIFNKSGSLTIKSGARFEQNEAYYGGALFVGGTTTITDAVFDSNVGHYTAGAIYSALESAGQSNILTVTGTQFTSNHSDYAGGAMGVFSTATIDQSSFVGNTSDDEGGAIFFGSKSNTLMISNTVFDGNTATNTGGALKTRIAEEGLPNLAFLNVSDSTFKNNSAAQGGAIFNTFSQDNGTVIANSIFDHNSADKGGAIYNTTGVNNGTTYIGKIAFSNTSFSNNTATTSGGAVYNTGTLSFSDGTSFVNNSANVSGGAIYNAGTITIGNNAVFMDNASHGTGDSHGSDIFNAAGTVTIGNGLSISRTTLSTTDHDCAIMNKNGGSVTIGDNATFTNVQQVLVAEANTTSTIGNNATFDHVSLGIANWGGTIVVGDNATFTNGIARSVQNAFGTTNVMTIGANAQFINNTDTNEANGGIIYSTANQNSTMTFGDGFLASGNTSTHGVYSVVSNNATNTLTFNGSATFKDNTANSVAGVLLNTGTTVFNGDATFSNNTINGVKHDIHNDGTLTFNGGTVTLDGGITGTGTVAFADGTTLKAALLADASTAAIIAATKLSGAINLSISDGTADGQIFFDASDNSLSLNDNALYNITEDTTTAGLYKIAKKSTDDLASDLNATHNEASMLDGLLSGTSTNTTFNALVEQTTTLLQSSDPAEVQAGLDALAAIGPTLAPAVVAQSTQTASQILGAVGTRLSGGSVAAAGQSSGDYASGQSAVWVQGLYNKSKFSGNDKFDARSKGFAIGLENNITDSVKLGFGYAYTNSQIKPVARKSDVNSNSAIVYGEYKPNNWFVNAVGSYTWSRYDDHNYSGGITIGNYYDVDSVAIQGITGYDFHMGASTLTPEAGLRYLNVKQNASVDTTGSLVHKNHSDVLTGVVGMTAKTTFDVSKNVALKPEMRIAATYDMVHDNVVSVMTLANGAVVSSQGEALERWAGEVGIGLTATIAKNLDLTVAYEGQFRKDYTDNTGIITAKFSF